MSDKLELFTEIDNNISEFENFTGFLRENINNEKKKSKLQLIKQLIGYYRQLLLKSFEILNQDDFNKYTNFQKNIENKMENINNSYESINLDDLEQIYNDINDQYQSLEKQVHSSQIKDYIQEYNNLVNKINENIILINKKELEQTIKTELKEIYDLVNSNKNITNLNKFLTKTNEIISGLFEINAKKGNFKERSFSLFAKINDQIIDSKFRRIDTVYAALYTLEDNSKYYSIIRDEKEIKILEQEFQNLPNLVLTKDKIIETCKIIIKNAGIYYEINEYMRYIEKSYKTKMTKQIDQLILKYKNKLRNLESIIINQLSFIDEIALIVNNIHSTKYPNIKYNGIPVNKFFETNIIDDKTKEINRIIIEKLLNPNIKSDFSTEEILKTLYSKELLDELKNDEYFSHSFTLDIDCAEELNFDMIKDEMVTNYEKISNYLKTRVAEFLLLKSSSKLNVTITKDSNTIYKEVNTILDLNMAIIICDKVYKEGQGIYAAIDYLKTGNTLKFTSKYKARSLASDVDRNIYLKKLVENIIRQYLCLKNKKESNLLINKLDYLLKNSNMRIENIIKSILEDDNILSFSITNFNYELLDRLSVQYCESENLLKNNSKVEELLLDLKKNNINLP